MKSTVNMYLIVIVWNFIVFCLFGLDKFLAKNHRYRISEMALLTAAIAMGGVGGLAGMYFFRHKTQHGNFKLLVPLAAIITVVAMFLKWFMG